VVLPNWVALSAAVVSLVVVVIVVIVAVSGCCCEKDIVAGIPTKMVRRPTAIGRISILLLLLLFLLAFFLLNIGDGKSASYLNKTLEYS
jgi:hypothetical protein